MLSFINRDWSLVATAIRDLSRTKVIDLGRRFTSPYLIVRVSTRNQKDTWYYGGKIFATNLVIGKQAKFYQVDLDLFEQELLIVPKYFEGKYSLLYEAPKYFNDVILKVWEYTGTIEAIDNKTNVLDLLASQEIIIRELSDKLEAIQNSLINLDITTEISDTQIQQINNNVSGTVSQLDDRIATLSSDLIEAITTPANTVPVTVIEDELI